MSKRAAPGDQGQSGTEPPPFSRPVRLTQLSRATTQAIDESASAEECAGVARHLGIDRVSKLRLRATLDPLDDSAWALRGTLGATVVQSCVATLEPVQTRIDTDLRRIYRPDLPAEGAELDLDPEAEDEVEPLPQTLDLGVVAVEELALNLPLYPRTADALSADVEVRPAGARPIAEAPSPFQALEALKAKLDDGPE